MIDGGCGFGGEDCDVTGLLLMDEFMSGGEDVGGALLAEGEEVGVAGFCLWGVLKGDLKGDLKGWERVFVAVFRRRRLEV